MIDQAETIGLLPATPMLISYDAPVRPQYWQLHPKNGNGIYFIAYYSPKAEALRHRRAGSPRAYQAKYNESPIYSSLNGFGDVMILAEAADAAKSTDPKAMVKALETGTFKSWRRCAVTFPRADGRLLAQLGAADPDPALHQAEPGLAAGGDPAGARRRSAHERRHVVASQRTALLCFSWTRTERRSCRP